MGKRYRRQEVTGAPTKWAVYVKRLGEEKQSDHLKSALFHLSEEVDSDGQLLTRLVLPS